MKNLVVCLSLLGIGCFGQTYNSTRIGPDRYTITSSGHDMGPENYGRLLENAYNTCNQASYKDYVVTNMAFDTRQVIMFIRCEKDIVRQDLVVQPLQQPDTNNGRGGASSLTQDLDNLYQSAKKKFQEATRE